MGRRHEAASCPGRDLTPTQENEHSAEGRSKTNRTFICRSTLIFPLNSMKSTPLWTHWSSIIWQRILLHYLIYCVKTERWTGALKETVVRGSHTDTHTHNSIQPSVSTSVLISRRGTRSLSLGLWREEEQRPHPRPRHHPLLWCTGSSRWVMRTDPSLSIKTSAASSSSILSFQQWHRDVLLWGQAVR